MWDLMVSVLDHCLSFSFEKVQKKSATFLTGNYNSETGNSELLC